MSLGMYSSAVNLANELEKDAEPGVCSDDIPRF